MPTLELTVSLKVDGVSASGFPLVRRIEVDETQTFAVERGTSGVAPSNYVALPTGEMAEIQVLVLRTDRAVSLRLHNSVVDGSGFPTNAPDGAIKLNAGGMIVVFDADIDAGTNAMLANGSGSTAIVRGVAAGT